MPFAVPEQKKPFETNPEEVTENKYFEVLSNFP
jgi:hypothetical protein